MVKSISSRKWLTPKDNSTFSSVCVYGSLSGFDIDLDIRIADCSKCIRLGFGSSSWEESKPSIVKKAMLQKKKLGVLLAALQEADAFLEKCIKEIKEHG